MNPHDKNNSVLVCNAGSSNLKVSEFLGDNSKSKSWRLEGSGVEIKDKFIELLNERPVSSAVLHRVVHAGLISEGPHKLTPELIKEIEKYKPLAPLHNGIALEYINIIKNKNINQFAFFDSGIYKNLSPVSKLYALPTNLSPNIPIQKYGFHGLAHRSQWRQIQSIKSYKKVITMQIGSGVSLTAWLDGKPIDTTMGFTPLDGLPMATRCGSIDPGIIFYLMSKEGKSLDELQNIFNYESGLKGLSGSSGDMRQLIDSDNEKARLAIEHYCYQIKKMIGAYFVALGGVDAICIGGGVGENQPIIRKKIFEDLGSTGVIFDEKNNTNDAEIKLLSKVTSKIVIYVTPVDEMLEMFNQYSQSLINKRIKNE